jgi:anti-anti-sigma factor
LQRFVRSPPADGRTLPFRCDVQPHRAAAHVVPVGELDLWTVPVVERELEQLREAGFRILVLDLRKLSFLDVAGLRLILRWSAAARDDGSRFAVIPGASCVQRLFELTATADQVQFIDASGSRSRRTVPPPRRRRELDRAGQP